MKFLRYFLLLLVLTSFSACEDFLQRAPEDQPSGETFWKSKGDFDNALTALYGDMQEAVYSSEVPNFDNITDNSYGQHNYGSSQAIVEGSISPSMGGYISGIYSTAYGNIARVNTFLKRLKSYDGGDISENQRTTYESQARFFRAFNYWKLYFFYGAVPIVKEPLKSENQVQPKSSAEEVFSIFLEDINFAIENLEDIHYANNEGHIVKSTALALKARALMYNGYDNNGNPNTDALEQVAALTKDIMEGDYQLASDYSDVFRTGTQEGNPEIIYSVKFLAPNNSHSMDQWYGDWLVVSPLQNMVDTYEASDGQPIEQSPLYDSEHPFENRDQRLKKSIFEDGPSFDGKTQDPTNPQPTGYGVNKFLTPGLIPYGYSTDSEQDWVVFRYGEILLIYAEAQNEVAGPDASVYKAVNKIRNRAGLPDLDPTFSQSEMRDKIRHERRVELAFEGLRYYDLKRWRIAGQVLNNVDDGILSYTFEERHYLWPLPQSEIDKSNGELEQNPNY